MHPFRSFAFDQRMRRCTVPLARPRIGFVARLRRRPLRTRPAQRSGAARTDRSSASVRSGHRAGSRRFRSGCPSPVSQGMGSPSSPGGRNSPRSETPARLPAVMPTIRCPICPVEQQDVWCWRVVMAKTTNPCVVTFQRFFKRQRWWRWCQTKSNQSHQEQDGCPLFGARTASLGEGGGTVSLESRSGSEAAFRVDEIVDGGEFPEASHWSDTTIRRVLPGHRASTGTPRRRPPAAFGKAHGRPPPWTPASPRANRALAPGRRSARHGSGSRPDRAAFALCGGLAAYRGRTDL